MVHGAIQHHKLVEHVDGREKGRHRSSQWEKMETLTSADNLQERGRTTSLVIIVAPTLTIVREVGLWLHGRSRSSSHHLWLSLPASVSRRRSCSLRQYPAASDLRRHPPTTTRAWNSFMPDLEMMQRSLPQQIRRRLALWPGVCHYIFVTNQEGILVEIKGSKLRTPNALRKSSWNKKKIHPKCRTLK